MKKYDGLIAMGYFAVIFFFESLMFAIVSELPFFAGNNHREKILWYAINFLVLTVMAAVLQRIYKDVLWDSIKGVSKWYILKNVIVDFLQ